MIDKEIWDSLAPPKQLEQLSEALTQLHDIERGTHALSGKPEQGRLTTIRKELELFVLQVIEWEKPKYENRKSEKNRSSTKGD